MKHADAIAALRSLGFTGYRGDTVWKCPLHPEADGWTLTVADGPESNARLTCSKGCSEEHILAALNLEESPPLLPAATPDAVPERERIDMIAAGAFIEALTGEAGTAVTFQTFTDKKPIPLPKGWKDRLARVLHGPLSSVAETLERLNDQGAGIFVCVNETDGKGRTRKNIVRVRSLFVDADKPMVRPFAVEPSFCVESSPGRSHAYWLVSGDDTLEGFTPAQKQLIAYYGTDPGIHELSRVMRLPGFWHRKGEPYPVRFVPGTGKVFSLAELLASHVPPPKPAIPATRLRKRTPGDRTEKLIKIVRDKADSRSWAEGNRHASAKTTAAHARKIGLPDDAIRALVLEYLTAAGKTADEADELADWTLDNVSVDPDEIDPPTGGTKATEGGTDEEGNDREPSCAAQLIEIGRTADLFHDERGDGYAAFTEGAVRRVMKIRSSDFAAELCRRYAEKHAFKKAANGEAVASARNVIEALARLKGEEHRLSTRFARHDGAVWIDMADSRWRAIRVSPERWEIVDTPPLLFRRFPHMRPLPEPVRGGDLAQLFAPFELGEAEKILLTAYVVTIPLGDIPRPLLLPHGPQGSGKTTLLKRILATVDPTGIDDLDLGGEARELAQLLDQHAVAFFDNVVRIGEASARLLCKAATGGGFEKRRLFTDEESVILTFRRVVMISAINVPTHAPDLLDRCLLLPLDRIPPEKRRLEADLNRDFDAERPATLGALLDALARAMAVYPQLQLRELPRMADFAAWGAAVTDGFASRLGEKQGAEAFLHAYNENIGRQTDEVLEADPVARAVRDLVQEEDWTGTASDLFAEMKKRHADEMNQKDSGWPKRANDLSRRLGILTSTLAEVGVTVRKAKEGKNRTRTITIAVKARKSSSASPASSAEAQQRLPGADDGADGAGIVVRHVVRQDPAPGVGADDADDGDDSFPDSTAALSRKVVGL